MAPPKVPENGEQGQADALIEHANKLADGGLSAV
jgi:hypothetical protein